MGYRINQIDRAGTSRFFRRETPQGALLLVTDSLDTGARLNIKNESGQTISPKELIEDAYRLDTSPRALEVLTDLLVVHVFRSLGPAARRDGGATEKQWLQTGEKWAQVFGQLPRAALVDELDRRIPHAHTGAFLRGAHAQLARIEGPPALASRAVGEDAMAVRRAEHSHEAGRRVPTPADISPTHGPPIVPRLKSGRRT